MVLTLSLNTSPTHRRDVGEMVMWLMLVASVAVVAAIVYGYARTPELDEYSSGDCPECHAPTPVCQVQPVHPIIVDSDEGMLGTLERIHQTQEQCNQDLMQIAAMLDTTT